MHLLSLFAFDGEGKGMEGRGGGVFYECFFAYKYLMKEFMIIKREQI